MTIKNKINFLLILQIYPDIRNLTEKVINKISEFELISVMLKRLKKSKKIDKIISAICNNAKKQKLTKITKKNIIKCI